MSVSLDEAALDPNIFLKGNKLQSVKTGSVSESNNDF
jgi:hypothetical protein